MGHRRLHTSLFNCFSFSVFFIESPWVIQFQHKVNVNHAVYIWNMPMIKQKNHSHFCDTKTGRGAREPLNQAPTWKVSTTSDKLTFLIWRRDAEGLGRSTASLCGRTREASRTSNPKAAKPIMTELKHAPDPLLFVGLINRMKTQTRKGNLTKLLKQAALEGVITCPVCGRSLEPDADECPCGWKNRLVKEGWI